MKMILWILLIISVNTFSSIALSSLSNDDLPNRRDGVSQHAVSLDNYALDSLYRVGPGDFFNIFIEGRMLTVQVTPEGSVGFERVGIISVTDLPLFEAKKKLRIALSDYYRDVHVQLAQLKTYKLSVLGNVKIPGQYQFTGINRLSFVIYAAGGLVGDADERNLLILRDGDTIRVNLKKAMDEGDLTYDPYVFQGDIIFASSLDKEKKQLHLLNEGNWTGIAFRDSMTVQDLLNESQYRNTDIASMDLIIRSLDGSYEMGTFQEMGNRILRSGASVELVQKEAYVYIGGSTSALGKVPYRPGYSPMSYIAAAGKNIISGSFDQIRVIRRDGTAVDMDPHTGIVMAGDYIELPRKTYETVKDVTIFLASLVSVFSTILMIYISLK